MSLSSVPSWSSKSLESMGVLYRSLQDIEVYVEDKDSEAFYRELLTRMLDDGLRIKKVFPLHGRQQVIDFCERFNHATPALFLIDGDLDIMLGLKQEGLRNLFQLQAYCIENYLFCMEGARELIVENSGVISRDEALTLEEWRDLIEPVSEVLRDLFVTFAVARCLSPEVKTVSHGHSVVLTQKTRARGPEFDIQKIKTLDAFVKAEALKVVSEIEWDRCKAEVQEQAKKLPVLDLVSGKDFLLPMLAHFIRSKSGGVTSNKSLMFRLARHCSLERLEDLRLAINGIISGSIYARN